MVPSTKAFFTVLSFSFVHPIPTLCECVWRTCLNICVGTRATAHILRSETTSPCLPPYFFRKDLYSVTCLCVYQHDWPMSPISLSESREYIHVLPCPALPEFWRFSVILVFEFTTHRVSYLPSHTYIWSSVQSGNNGHTSPSYGHLIEAVGKDLEPKDQWETLTLKL